MLLKTLSLQFLLLLATASALYAQTANQNKRADQLAQFLKQNGLGLTPGYVPKKPGDRPIIRVTTETVPARTMFTTHPTPAYGVLKISTIQFGDIRSVAGDEYTDAYERLITIAFPDRPIAVEKGDTLVLEIPSRKGHILETIRMATDRPPVKKYSVELSIPLPHIEDAAKQKVLRNRINAYIKAIIEDR